MRSVGPNENEPEFTHALAHKRTKSSIAGVRFASLKMVNQQQLLIEIWANLNGSGTSRYGAIRIVLAAHSVQAHVFG